MTSEATEHWKQAAMAWKEAAQTAQIVINALQETLKAERDALLRLGVPRCHHCGSETIEWQPLGTADTKPPPVRPDSRPCACEAPYKPRGECKPFEGYLCPCGCHKEAEPPAEKRCGNCARYDASRTYECAHLGLGVESSAWPCDDFEPTTENK
jgi:hypothetical protein